MNIVENFNTPILKTANLTSKYKKLCLLFHPDKNHNPRSAKIFTIINKIYTETTPNSNILINIIDLIAHNVLECQTEANNLESLDTESSIIRVALVGYIAVLILRIIDYYA